jgi:SPP1 family predicted phage head-tail adaptor
MKMDPGELRDRVTIERATVVEDDHGGETPTWGVHATRWGQVLYGRGEERRAAAQEQASVPATFRVRQDSVTSGILPTDRLQFDGAAWDISSVVPLGRDLIEITAVRGGL